MTLSKRGNEVTGYVVREGAERGRGRYLNSCAGPVCGEPYVLGVLGKDTEVWSDVEAAHHWATEFSGRVVAVVRKSTPAKPVATEEDSARYVTAYNAMHSIDWSDRCLAGIQAVLDGRAADLRALSPEGGEPPEGSRLWRCEKELTKARAKLEKLAEEYRLFRADARHELQVTKDAAAALALLPTPLERDEHAKQLDILRADLARMREERDEVEDQFRIARADLARMTEQRDVSTERERGLAAKLEAVREAAR